MLIVTSGRQRVEREHDRRAGAGVAGGIGVLGDDGVGAIARQRDGGGPQPARADGRGADRGGDAADGVEQRHGGADRGLAGGDTPGITSAQNGAMIGLLAPPLMTDECMHRSVQRT